MSQAVIAEAVLKNVLYFFDHDLFVAETSYLLQKLLISSLFPHELTKNCKEIFVTNHSLRDLPLITGGTRGKYVTDFCHG